MDTLSLVIAIFAGIIAIAALILSLMNTFNTPAPGPTGPTGPPGPQGPTGPPGRDTFFPTQSINNQPLQMQTNPPQMQISTPPMQINTTQMQMNPPQMQMNPPQIRYLPQGIPPANISLNNSSYRTATLKGQYFNLTGPVTSNPAVFFERDMSLQPGESFTINTKLLDTQLGIISTYYYISGNAPNNVVMLNPNHIYILTLQNDGMTLLLTNGDNQKQCSIPDTTNRFTYTTANWM